ncbi:MAG: hypothetical protein AAFU85_09975 [Planctomycetota bacterium]
MKAFGVRLAAGAATILVGFIMATQSQKNLQTEADSAWTEDSIPPAKPVAPVGRGSLISADPWPDELKPFDNPFDDDDAENDEPRGAIALVGHTQAPDSTDGAMLLPAAGQGTPTGNSSAPATASTMKLILPGDESSPAPATELPPSPVSPMEMTTPTLSISPPSQSGGAGERPSAPGSVAGFPSNGLRGSGSLRGQSSDLLQSLAEQAGRGPEANPATGAQPAPRSSALGDVTQLLLQVPPSGNGLSSEQPTGQANETIIPSMTLRPVPAGPESGLVVPPTSSSLPTSGAPTIVSGPSSMPSPSIQADAMAFAGSVATPTMGAPTAMAGPDSTDATPPSSALGSPSSNFSATPSISTTPNAIATSPSFVDQYNQVPPANLTQPVSGFGGNGSYNQPAGGISNVPANYGGVPRPSQPAMPSDNRTFAPQAAPGLAQPYSAAPLPNSVPQARTASLPRGGELYQPAGYRDRGMERPLPPGPTMAAPGDRKLDGPQSPSVVIHKRAPAEVKVGKQATFVITVKNVGGATAMDVRVRDRIPTGMRLDDASPRPDPKFKEELVWDLGSLEPQQERTITLQLTPLQEGELGSVARVTFQAAASVRTISTRPELKIVQKAPEQVPIGQLVEIELEISNPGTGEATGVVLQEDVPVGLEHPQGRELDNFIGNLGPGEVRRQVLRMKAVQPGTVENTIRVKADDGLETYHSVPIQIIAPKLQIALTGPSKRYLERQAKFELYVGNAGTDVAENIDISVQLDRGFTFVSTDYEGQYDASRHAVFWSLPQLPVGENGRVPLVLLPVEEGNRVLRAQASADRGITASSESQVLVDSLAELTFSINDSADPVEIGGETTYEIRVSNSGSRDDTNVRVHLQLPQGMRLVGNGDFQTDNKGLVVFTPRAMLKANEEVVYRVRAQGLAQGRHLVKAIVTSDQSQVPVTKEESIMVYADQ